MRKVLIFSLTYFPDHVGGAEVAVKEITDRIAPGDFEFHMITLGRDYRGDTSVSGSKWPLRGIDYRGVTSVFGNIYMHRILGKVDPIQKLLFPFAAYLKARSLHRQEKFDIIWSIMANRAGFAALFFSWTFGKIPFVLTLQEGDPLDYPLKRAWFIYPLFKKIFRRASHITAISVFLADWAKRMGAKCPITLIPNGIDYEHFSRPVASEEIRNLEAGLNKTKNDVFIVTVSRLVKKNAVADIILTLPYLPDNIKLLIIGTGEEKANLQKLIFDLSKNNIQTSLALGKRVYFLGHISHKKLPAYLAVADIFIRPSLSEGLGNSFLEAMASGIPVIATPVGGIVDFLEDGKTGLFCEVGKPESIAKKIQILLRDVELKKNIVKNARQMVAEKYQWHDISSKIEKVFTEVTPR